MGVVVRVLAAAIVFAVAAALGGAILASVYASATNMPNREGGPGAFAIAIAFAAGLVGGVGGILFGLQRYAGFSTGRSATAILLAIAAIGCSMVAYRWHYTRSQAYFTRKYSSVPLEIEVRGGNTRVKAMLQEDDGGAMPVEWDEAGRNGIARLWQVTNRRVLLVEGNRLELSELPSFPGATTEWSPWVSCGRGVEIRYRVKID